MSLKSINLSVIITESIVEYEYKLFLRDIIIIILVELGFYSSCVQFLLLQYFR